MERAIGTPTYQPDGVTYGSLEDVGDTMLVCDVCEYVGYVFDKDGDDCPACVAKWEAAND